MRERGGFLGQVLGAVECLHRRRGARDLLRVERGDRRQGVLELAVTAAAVASFIAAEYLPVLGTLYAVRLVPDYLITARKIKKRKEHFPVLPFLISEIVYPFWFCAVAVVSLFPSSRRFSRR